MTSVLFTLGRCALLVLEQGGHGCARLHQLCVSPRARSESFQASYPYPYPYP